MLGVSQILKRKQGNFIYFIFDGFMFLERSISKRATTGMPCPAAT